MKQQEEISDLVYLGRRLDKVLEYLIKTDSKLKVDFLKYVENYFMPIIEGNITQEEEDYFFGEIDSIVDELEETYSEKFENKSF